MIHTFTAVLAFTQDLTHVAMVRKNTKGKFPMLDGKWNGIGGGIEIGEAPASAAAREFVEETGISLTKDDLVNIEHQRFYILAPAEVHIYWYAARLPAAVVLPSENDVGEHLAMVPMLGIHPSAKWLCPNLGYLVPKAITFLQTPLLDRPC